MKKSFQLGGKNIFSFVVDTVLGGLGKFWGTLMSHDHRWLKSGVEGDGGRWVGLMLSQLPSRLTARQADEPLHTQGRMSG